MNSRSNLMPTAWPFSCLDIVCTWLTWKALKANTAAETIKKRTSFPSFWANRSAFRSIYFLDKTQWMQIRNMAEQSLRCHLRSCNNLILISKGKILQLSLKLRIFCTKFIFLISSSCEKKIVVFKKLLQEFVPQYPRDYKLPLSAHWKGLMFSSFRRYDAQYPWMRGKEIQEGTASPFKKNSQNYPIIESIGFNSSIQLCWLL